MKAAPAAFALAPASPLGSSKMPLLLLLLHDTGVSVASLPCLELRRSWRKQGGTMRKRRLRLRATTTLVPAVAHIQSVSRTLPLNA